MKTAQEILHDNSFQTEYGLMQYECDILESMEEYANQFKEPWIDVNDAIPENDQEITVLLNDGSIHNSVYDNGHFRYTWNLSPSWYGVTHWKPLNY